MLQRLSLAWRLGLGFGLLAVMAVILVGVASFGLEIAQKSLNGITGTLIPANAIASRGKYALMQARAAQEGMLSQLGRPEALAKLRAEWASTQAVLDEGMDGYQKLARDEEAKANLARFRSFLETYRAGTAPAIDRIASGGVPDVESARALLQPGASAYEDVVSMLANIEAGQVMRGSEIFAKVSSALAFIRSLLLGLCILAAAAAVLLTWRVTQSVVRPVRWAVQEAQSLADGDLRATSEPQGSDELAQMLRAMAAMRDALAEVVGKVRDAAEGVGVASAEVATGNADLSIRTETTASSLQETAASMDQLASAVRQTAELTRTADALAQQAGETASAGGAAVAEVVRTMSEIQARSRRISEIVGVIDSIAFQTNILALNSAVEAARAGEQGRGFGVVASDVRLLAQRCAEASREIRGLIEASVEKVEEGMQRAQSTGATMEVLLGNVRKVGGVMGEISEATDNQSVSVNQIAAAVGHLDRSTQQNAALVEQSAAAAASLQDQAERLVEAVSIFRLV